jgi:hypothetical protein
MVYALTEGGLRVLDVANPMSPALRGSFTLRGANQSLMVLSPTVVLTTNYSSGLNVIDVSDPAQPSRIGSYVGDGFARGVTAAGTMAYLTDWPSGLYVLSLVKDRDPEVVSQLRTPGEQTGIEDPRSFTPAVTLTEPAPSAPTTLVSVLDQGGSLHVFDVTKPAAAVETATLRISGTPRRMRTQGRLAFIAAGPAGVHVVDLSNPSKPAVVTQAATKAQAHDVALGESTMFVAAGGDGVIVFRRTP